MKKLEEYRQHATHCRELARQMENDEQKAQLIRMAQTWDKLATDRVKTLAHPTIHRSPAEGKAAAATDAAAASPREVTPARFRE